MIIADPDVSFFSEEGKQKFISRAIEGFDKAPPVNRTFNQNELLEMLDETGFNVVSKEIIHDTSNKYNPSANYIKANTKYCR